MEAHVCSYIIIIVLVEIGLVRGMNLEDRGKNAILALLVGAGALSLVIVGIHICHFTYKYNNRRRTLGSIRSSVGRSPSKSAQRAPIKDKDELKGENRIDTEPLETDTQRNV